MFLAIVKAFDTKLACEWHSGSCSYYKVKTDCSTREEAETFVRQIVDGYYKNNTEQYQFTELVMEYLEKDAESVQKMFKYMS